MQNILVVKNDELFLNTISERLVLNENVSFLDRLGHSIPEGFFDLEIYRVPNGQQAIKTLSQYPIDIVITDLKMPKINGLELIVYMNGHYPNTPIIVMADIAPITMSKVLDQDGISHYIERPFSIEAIKKSVMEVLIVKLLNPEREVYSSISVSSLMQLISTSKLTYTVYLKSGDRVGRIYFLYGKLIGAETERNTGEDAIYELLGWKNPVILLEPTCNNVEETIKVSLIHILKKSIKALHGYGAIDSSKLLKRSALPPNEKTPELKKLYRHLAKKFHPDQNDDFSEEVKNYWLLIMNAYNKGEVENLKILSLITSSLTEAGFFRDESDEEETSSEGVPDHDLNMEPETEERAELESGNETGPEEQEDIEQPEKETASTKSEPEPELKPEEEDEEVSGESDVTDEETSEAEADTGVEEKAEVRIDEQKAVEILSDLYPVKGFLAAGIVSAKGDLLVQASEIEKWASNPISIELKKLFDKINGLTDRIEFEYAQEVFLCSKNGSVLITVLNREDKKRPLLFALLDGEGNLALTKLTVKKIIPKLKKLIEN